ncbi:TetR/AcrR family transcriptional regulator [Gorillibacterium sp. sgz5001074]|uniref:TetR/AcrR family transcriptional regulator n=1 Tax=Gorillibacterium sp. sgz5001074 TaxID=3446695 RepID=UPI003F67CCF3
MKDLILSMLDPAVSERKPSPGRTPSDTECRILAAALEQFAEKGYSGATTMAIAKRAGVSEKTLFQRFGSKEQLFLQTALPSILESIEPLIRREQAQSKAQLEAPLAEQLFRVAQDRLHFALEQPHTVQVLLRELLLQTPYREAVTELWMKRLAPSLQEMIASRQAAGEIRDLPVSTVLRTVIPVFMGYAVIRSVLHPDGEWEDNKELELMIDILLNGLLPR